MAEQAQRRVPVAGAAPNDATDAEEKRAHDARDYVELRRLLNVPEQSEISGIQDRLDNVERRTADVGQVVAEAIQFRREQGDDGGGTGCDRAGDQADEPEDVADGADGGCGGSHLGAGEIDGLRAHGGI